MIQFMKLSSTMTPNRIACLLLSGALIALPACQSEDTSGASQDNATWQLPDVKKQARVHTSRDIDFPADKVWELIAGFNTLPDYHAAMASSKLLQGGAIRHVTLSDEAGGGVVVERLVYLNDETKTFSYTIIGFIDCDLPLRHYQSRVHVTSTGENSCKIVWESYFDVEGATKEDAIASTEEFYEGGFDGIIKVLSGQGESE